MRQIISDRRTFLTGLGLSGVGITLAACSSPDMDSASQTEGNEEGGGAGLSGTITLYTSEPETKINEIIAAFNEETPDVEVQVYRAGTGEIDAKIKSEASAGGVQADVLLAADRPTFEGYKSEGLLAPLEVAEPEALLEGFVDPDGYYVGTRIIPTVLAINTNSDITPPASWADLTDPEYSGQIAMPSPDVSGAAAFNTAVWLDEPSLGEDWLTALVANEPTVLQSNGPVSQAVAEGSPPLGIVVDYLVRELNAQGSPIETIYPSEGVPYVDQPAAIFEASQNKEAAQAFINFLVSKRGQELAVQQSYVPVRGDVGSPEGAPSLDDLTLFEVDPKEVSEKKADAVQLFDDLIAGN